MHVRKNYATLEINRANVFARATAMLSSKKVSYDGETLSGGGTGREKRNIQFLSSFEQLDVVI